MEARTKDRANILIAQHLPILLRLFKIVHKRVSNPLKVMYF